MKLNKAKVTTGLNIITKSYGGINSYYILHTYLPSICNIDKKWKIGSNSYKKSFNSNIFNIL